MADLYERNLWGLIADYGLLVTSGLLAWGTFQLARSTMRLEQWAESEFRAARLPRARPPGLRRSSPGRADDRDAFATEYRSLEEDIIAALSADDEGRWPGSARRARASRSTSSPMAPPRPTSSTSSRWRRPTTRESSMVRAGTSRRAAARS